MVEATTRVAPTQSPHHFVKYGRGDHKGHPYVRPHHLVHFQMSTMGRMNTLYSAAIYWMQTGMETLTLCPVGVNFPVFLSTLNENTSSLS